MNLPNANLADVGPFPSMVDQPVKLPCKIQPYVRFPWYHIPLLHYMHALDALPTYIPFQRLCYPRLSLPWYHLTGRILLPPPPNSSVATFR